MKKLTKWMGIMIVATGLAAGGVWAVGPDDCPMNNDGPPCMDMQRGMHGQHWKGKRGMRGPGMGMMGGGMHLLWMTEHNNVAAKILAGMTDKPETEIQEKLKDSPMPELLAEYKVDHLAFHTAMSTELIKMIDKAEKDGSITAAQATEIKEQHQKFTEKMTQRMSNCTQK
ncbi:MAG: hypothetical protein HQM12_08905 [SAR324 cluster bacterium]|nr:hypothetical protein [SAR324 cluster bacterium]